MKPNMPFGEESTRTRPLSIGELFRNIVGNIQEIIRSEVQLAKTEIRQQVSEMTKTGSLFAAAAVCGLFAVGFILLGAVYALSIILPAWLSAVIVGAAAGIAGYALYVVARRKAKTMKVKPEETINSLRENVTWIRRQTR